MKIASLVIALALVTPLGSYAARPDTLPKGAKVFIQPMNDGFDTYIKSAIAKKNVPIVVVNSLQEADYEMKGSSETQKASAAKKVMLGSWHSDEQASISISGIKSGEVVFAYSANKKNSAHGKQSSAEACAKHLKDEIEKGK